MKLKLLSLTIVSWFFSAFGYKAMAQQEETTKKETEEIIIRRQGEKDARIIIELSGDKITVNGKPLMEFSDDSISVSKRKVIVRNRNRMNLGENFNFNFDDMNWNAEKTSRTFLGVVTEKTDDGVKVTEVTKDSPAEKAGIEKDDIITQVGDVKISTSQELYDAIVRKKAGDEVKVSMKRGKKNKTVTAKLAEKKESGTMSFSMVTPDGGHKVFTVPSKPSAPSAPNAERWELNDLQSLKELEQLNSGAYSFEFPRQQKLGLKIQDTEDNNGVKVMDIDENSAAEKAGLKEGDIISEIGGKKITNTDEAREWLRQNKDKTSYTIKARRSGKEMSFEVKIPKKLKTTTL